MNTNYKLRGVSNPIWHLNWTTLGLVLECMKSTSGVIIVRHVFTLISRSLINPCPVFPLPRRNISFGVRKWKHKTSTSPTWRWERAQHRTNDYYSSLDHSRDWYLHCPLSDNKTRGTVPSVTKAPQTMCETISVSLRPVPVRRKAHQITRVRSFGWVY